MIVKQKILLIIIAVLFLISLIGNLSRLVPESRNYENYTKALSEYNDNEYIDAYYSFGKVSKFSKLKPAAIYRQALCSDKLGDTKTEIKKYKEIIRYYPSSALSLRAKYLKAQQLYENENYKKAKKEFKNILTRNPKTDYALAAQYYLGSIEAINASKTKNNKKKTKLTTNAVKYFKNYLKSSPDGKFAISSVQKWVALNTKLTNEDNLLIAQIYQTNGNYRQAKKYLGLTNISISWPYFVKNAYALKNYPLVRYYTVQGLKGVGRGQVLINENVNDKEENENIYKAIDSYLDISADPKISIAYLLSISEGSKGHDYLLYKSCNNLPVTSQTACYNTLFYKYPDGQFAGESLANIFYSKVNSQNYFVARKLGRLHLSKFRDTKSAPKVMFWLAKVSERTKNYEEARDYYKNLIREFPDDYYAYHAFLNLNKFRYFHITKLTNKPVKFPYQNSNYELISELVKVNDYGLINQLYKDDKFIQSWLLYQQGDYSSSARIARDAMDNVKQKPNRFDLRWRLVYPIHYYDEIDQNATQWRNDPTLILSIIKEESYFNPTAKSPAGARGLMQLMPITAREAALRGGISLPNNNLLFDPHINIKLGNIYFSGLKRTLSSKDILAVLAYNGGIGSVSKWTQNTNCYDIDDFVEQVPYAETQNYLKKVYKSYWNYLRIYDGIKF